MALQRVWFGIFVVFALIITEVTSWTIDLPEARQFFFKKNDKVEKERKYEIYKYKNEDNPVLYSNREGNSKHNEKHFDGYEDTAYAREFGYESYMEKKVNGIVYNGSVYLEGLHRSLENYTRLLEDCDRNNNSTRAGQNVSAVWLPRMESPDPGNTTANSTRCREATRSTEHVRRLSQLAMWATRELQDIAYARNYNKDDEHSLSMQENELILKLAWFLDRLAHYTGYEPQAGDFPPVRPNDPASSTPPVPGSLVSAPPELQRQMMECLQQNSSAAAVDRCRYPDPLPPIVQTMMEMNSNITGIPSMPATPPSNQQVVPLPSSDPVAEQSLELLVASDYRTPSSNRRSLTARMTSGYPSLTAVRTIRKRSISSMEAVQEKEQEMSREKLQNAPILTRSATGRPSLIENEPAMNFLKYFAKHKVWDGSNSKNLDSKTFQQYEVENHLTHILSKRAIHKKSEHLKLPENPFQDLSKYIKHKAGVHYVKDLGLAEKIKEALEKMDSKPSLKNVLRKLPKTLRQKRSIKFEKDVDLPRESGDPQGDISYYIKNKPGTNYNSDLRQALQVRTGLQQVFNTGNIEVVRRYGANYNPLIPSPFFAGILKSMADFRK